MTQAAKIEAWLGEWLEKNGGVAGTVHLLQGDELVLHAAVNIPPQVRAVVQTVPRGKGMAGLAYERDAPVSTCNLKTDTSGDVRPGAKAVNANAAVAIPIHHPGGAFRGVVGIAYLGEREMDDRELARLTSEAEALPA